MEKRAVIDIGTNSVRLLIGELNGKRINVINKWVVPTRLGEGINRNGVLDIKPIERTLDAVRSLIQIVYANNVDDVFCFATSAVRDAGNSEYFIEKLKKSCAVDVQVLTGEQEAKAGFIGASINLLYNEIEMVLVDIGGGSTELIQGKGEHISCAVSLNIGAVRLTEMFPLGYPIDYDNWNAMSCYIKDIVKQQWRQDCLSLPLIGIGGTITSLAAMDQELEEYDEKKIQGYCLELQSIKRMLKKIFSCSIEERKKIPGLHPSRSDIIPAGICILLKIMEYFNRENIIVSAHDNLEGMLILSSEKNLKKNLKKGLTYS